MQSLKVIIDSKKTKMNTDLVVDKSSSALKNKEQSHSSRPSLSVTRRVDLASKIYEGGFGINETNYHFLDKETLSRIVDVVKESASSPTKHKFK